VVNRIKVGCTCVHILCLLQGGSVKLLNGGSEWQFTTQLNGDSVNYNYEGMAKHT